MANNIDRIRSKSREALARISGRYGSAVPPIAPGDKAELASLFSEAVRARDAAVNELSSLLELRVSAHESALSGYIASYYARSVSRRMGSVEVLFRALDLVSSDEFTRKFDAAVFVLENTYSEDTILSLANYFDSKFDEMVSIAYPEGDVAVDYVVGTGLREDAVAVSEPLSNENRIYLILEVLGKLKNISNPAMRSDISAYKIYAVGGDVEESFPYLIRKNISSLATGISDLVSSKKFMDAQRLERDPSFRIDEDARFNSAFDKIAEIMPLLSDLTPESVSSLKESGAYDRLSAAVAESTSISEEMVLGSVSAIEQLEDYLEDYQAFIRLPQEETRAMEIAIQVCEEAEQRYAQYRDQLQSGEFSTPFSTGTEDSSRPSLSKWQADVDSTAQINGNRFEMVLLYMGTVGRDFLTEESYTALSNRAFSSIYGKGLVRSEALKASFASSRTSEASLYSDSGVRVSQRPGDEPVPFAIKSRLPGLEILDYIDFSPALGFTSASVDPDEVSLRNTVRLIILEAFGRVRKSELNQAIVGTIAAVTSWRRENLKGLYTEICFKEAVDLFKEYLDGLASPLEETRLDQTTLNVIAQYQSSNPTTSELEGWLEQYAAVHAAIHGSSSASDLLEDALLEGSEIKEVLLG